MASITQYLNAAPWGDALRAGIASAGSAAFWIAALQIVVINVLLWGDNAVVIALACRGLPPRQRFWGTAIGAGIAAALLVVFAGLVARLMALPYLKLFGGIALLYVGVRLLVAAGADKAAGAAPVQFWQVVRVVLLIDVVMSFDNVIAVAAAARGNLALLAIGLVISIPIILAGATLITALFERWPLLVWAGAALLGWIAGEVMASDRALSGYLDGGELARQIALAAAGGGAVLVLAIGGVWRQLRRRARDNTKA